MNNNNIKNIFAIDYFKNVNDIEYNFSYDFMVRPRALDVWENLLRILIS